MAQKRKPPQQPLQSQSEISTSDFFSEIEQDPCDCHAKKTAIYKFTYDERWGNCQPDEQPQVLVLLEHKEVDKGLNTFLAFCRANLGNKGIKYTILVGLGCTPKVSEFKGSVVGAYIECKHINIKSRIEKLAPRVIITTGRALYTITESDDLLPEHFYALHPDDNWLWSREFGCKVFPCPPLYQWCEEEILDLWETFFTRKQFIAAIKSLTEERIRRPVVKFINHKDPNDLIRKLIADTSIKEVAFDTETGTDDGEGKNYFKDELYSCSMSWDGVTGHFFKLKDIDKQLLIDLFNINKCFIFQNGQFDLKFLRTNGIYNARCDFDTMLAAHSLNECSPNGLKPLAFLYTTEGGYDQIQHKYLKEYKIKDFRRLPEQILVKYAAYDAVVTYQLYTYFSKRLAEEETFLQHNFYNYVMPAVPMITNVEMRGIQIDMNYLIEYNNNLEKKAADIREKIFAFCGTRDVNLGSTKQLSEIFRKIPNFEVLLDDKGNPMVTKSGDLKLDKEALQRYADKGIEIAMLIVDYNHVVKEISQLGLSSLRNSADHQYEVLFEEEEVSVDSKKRKGFIWSIHNKRLHTGYKLHGTETGRMAGGGGLDSSINFQNIQGIYEFRKMFLPEAGYLILEADYKTMEVAIAAQLSGDKVLEDIIMNDKDFHSMTGTTIMNLQGKDITYEEFFSRVNVEGKEDPVLKKYRKAAKLTNFGILYGTTKYGLARRLKIPVDEAQQYIEAFLNTYPDFKAYMEEYRDHAKKYGWVPTLLGRKRHLAELTYIGRDTFGKKNKGVDVINLLNSAINSPDQGTSGQTTVIAMTNIESEFTEKAMKSRILGNVHDSILIEVWIQELDQVVEIIERLMTKPYYENLKGSKVKLKVDITYGDVWGHGRTPTYWSTHQEELKEVIKSIEDRNATNKSIEDIM